MAEKIEQASSVDIESLYNQFLNWTQNEISVMDFGLQIGLLLFAVVLAMIASLRLDAWASRLEEQFQGYAVSRLFATIRDIAFPLSWLLIQWLAIVVPRLLEQEDKLLVVTTSLLTAWVFIRIVSTLITNPLIRRSVTTLAWVWAALTILGLADDTRTVMSDIGFAMGGVKLTLMGVFEGVVTLVVLLWAASFAAQIFENAVNKSPNLTPSIQVLSSKLIRMALLALAFFGSLAIVGIDLTALAVFSGAIGVGLGFGLQKIFGNLVSGIILLLDKSIKPGDVIAVADYYGQVHSLGARYVSVLTRDGVEHLIPNEDLIVNRVENWTHSQSLLRLRQPLGVHYKSDVHKAMRLCVEAAAEIPRILEDPAPNCLMRGYGDSAVDLEVRFWVNDPMNGRASVKSALLVNIWEKFHANNIEIPYPQRDLHIKSSELGSASDLSLDSD